MGLTGIQAFTFTFFVISMVLFVAIVLILFLVGPPCRFRPVMSAFLFFYAFGASRLPFLLPIFMSWSRMPALFIAEGGRQNVIPGAAC